MAQHAVATAGPVSVEVPASRSAPAAAAATPRAVETGKQTPAIADPGLPRLCLNKHLIGAACKPAVLKLTGPQTWWTNSSGSERMLYSGTVFLQHLLQRVRPCFLALQ